MNFRNNFKKIALIVSASIASSIAFVQVAQAQAETNPYSPRYQHSYRHGAHATREASQQMQAWAQTNAPALRAGSKTLAFGGGVNGIGVTSGKPKVYLVVFGSQWGTAGTDGNGNMTLSNDAVGAVPYLQKMFKGLGTNNELWSGVMTQFCDGPLVASGAISCPAGAPHIGYPTGDAFAGIWYDNSAASPASATAMNIADEAVKAAAHFGNTTPQSNRYVQYVILSPSGTHPDGFNTPNGGFCAWHDWNGDIGANSPYGDIAFTNMPYVYDMGSSCGAGSVNGNTAQGKLDGFSIVEGHEYSETITDQNPAGGWTNPGNGQENADECSWISSGQGAAANVVMSTGSFAMQSTWSNDTNRCDISHPIVDGSSVPPPPTVLTNKVPVSGLALAKGAQKYYSIVLPAGKTILTLKTSGGKGDADIFVSLGSLPTTSNYLRKSTGSTNSDSIRITAAKPGTYYLLLNATTTFSGLTLTATY